MFAIVRGGVIPNRQTLYAMHAKEIYYIYTQKNMLNSLKITAKAAIFASLPISFS